MNNKKSICPHAKKCGGCQLLNLSYEEQLKHKQVKAIRLLGKFCHVEEIIGMENPYNYRNKAQYAFGRGRNNQIIAGVYQSSTHKIIDIEMLVNVICHIRDGAPISDRFYRLPFKTPELNFSWRCPEKK